MCNSFEGSIEALLVLGADLIRLKGVHVKTTGIWKIPKKRLFFVHMSGDFAVLFETVQKKREQAVK